MLVLSACAQQAAPTTPTTPTTPAAPTTPTTPTTPAAPQVVTQEPVYKVLNPTGNYTPVECHPLAPRLSTLAGKNIYYYESEADPVIMPVLLAHLKKDYPTATWKYYETQGWGTDTPTADDLKGVDAVIRGIGW
jgi:hypothetical protein